MVMLMISFDSGARLCMSARCAAATARTEYLSGVDSLKKDTELCHEGRYYSYGRVLPQGDPAVFSRFCSFIERNRLVSAKMTQE